MNWFASLADDEVKLNAGCPSNTKSTGQKECECVGLHYCKTTTPFVRVLQVMNAATESVSSIHEFTKTRIRVDLGQLRLVTTRVSTSGRPRFFLHALKASKN